MGLQHIRHSANLRMQLTVCNGAARNRRVVSFPKYGGLISALGKMSIEAIGAHIEFPALIPSNLHRSMEGSVLHFGPFLDPAEASALLCPKCLRLTNRRFVISFVLL